MSQRRTAVSGQIRLSRLTPGTVPAASDVPRLADQVHSALQIVDLCHDRTKAFDLTVDAGKSSDLLTDIVSLDDLICPP